MIPFPSMCSGLKLFSINWVPSIIQQMTKTLLIRCSQGLDQHIICLFVTLNHVLLLCPSMISAVCCLVRKPNWLRTLCKSKLLPFQPNTLHVNPTPKIKEVDRVGRPHMDKFMAVISHLDLFQILTILTIFQVAQIINFPISSHVAFFHMIL